MGKEKKQKSKHKYLSRELLESLEKEDRILSDHGSFIIGERVEYPTQFENEEEETEEK